MRDCTCGGDIPDVGLNTDNLELRDRECSWHGDGSVYVDEVKS